MPTAFPAVLDTLQGRAERLAAIVDEMTSGRFRIEVLPSGRIMPPFECFDPASKGSSSPGDRSMITTGKGTLEPGGRPSQ